MTQHAKRLEKLYLDCMWVEQEGFVVDPKQRPPTEPVLNADTAFLLKLAKAKAQAGPSPSQGE